MKMTIRYFCLLFVFFYFTHVDVCVSQTQTVNLEDSTNFKLIDTKVEAVEYEGKSAIQVMITKDGNASGLAIIEGIEFKNGTIEIELAGKPKAGAPDFARGFIGVAFHVSVENPSEFELFYLRPVNSVADNEEQRNHTVQYSSDPDYPWNRLREENPGKYEAYAKMEPGKWTKMKIVVNGTTAQLFIGDADEPCLTVNDLKLGGRGGAVALQLHTTTDAYFRNLIITNK